MHVAVKSIENSRRMRYQSLNAYRKRFSMKPYSSFQDLTGEPKVTEGPTSEPKVIEGGTGEPKVTEGGPTGEPKVTEGGPTGGFNHE